MLDLRAKLSSLSPRGAEGRGEAKPPPASPVRDSSLTASPTAHGLLHSTRRAWAKDALHGRAHLTGAWSVTGTALARLALDESLRDVDPSRLLFVDTETTGLHGGAGTLPFLIGLGWLEDEALVVQQLFLPRPGQEAPMLRSLAERLEQASVMVTFNGKCFDWPLLRTRLVMNRLPAAAPAAHVDLLHCARRLFRRRLGATRLQDLERQVLGFHRVGDVDGAEIPAVYFDYLRRGATARLEQVLVHNQLDVVSMAGVLADLARRLDSVRDDDAAEDCLSLAELALRHGDVVRSEALAVLAAERASDDTTALEALWLAARLAGRRRDWALAAHRLNTALGLPRLTRSQQGQVHLALARLCEHRLKDRARALQHARSGAAAEAPAAHARRVSRLAPRGGVAQLPLAPR